MKYGVFQRDILTGKENPCSTKGFPKITPLCWSNNEFPTFEEACEYARAWGECRGTVNSGVQFKLNVPYQFGLIDSVVIKEVVEITTVPEDKPIIGYVLKTSDGKFALQDTNSSWLFKSDTVSFSPMGRTVFSLKEANDMVESWNKSPTYGFTNMTIHPLFLGEKV